MPREVARLSSSAEDWARVCIRAANLRAKFWTFVKIAAELDLPSPKEAQRAVRQGIALIPADDVREVRRLEDVRLAEAGAKLLEIIADPGPLVSQGKIMTFTSADGVERVFEDRMVQVRAVEALLKVSAESRKLHGADAPKKTMVITQDMITERIMELRRELGDAADSIPGLALPSGSDPDDDDGQAGVPARV
jgi:hypothetical protein